LLRKAEEKTGGGKNEAVEAGKSGKGDMGREGIVEPTINRTGNQTMGRKRLDTERSDDEAAGDSLSSNSSSKKRSRSIATRTKGVDEDKDPFMRLLASSNDKSKKATTLGHYPKSRMKAHF